MQKSPDCTALWIYGTKGYGKSHLLAALVCYLTTQGKRVVYIPDCRECIKSPVTYVQAAMLFAWTDDKAIQDEIITLDTQEKIQDFFDDHLDAIFFIDQVNGFAKMNREVKEWLDSCRAWHKAILSTSANYTSYLETAEKESTEEIIYVYAGFTPVSLGKE
jgi:chromosomal replication initiation ATPase DnaA